MILTDRAFSRSVIGAISLGFAILLLVGIMGGLVLREAQRQGEWVTHTFQVESALQQIKALTERVATARRGYLLSGGDEDYAAILETVGAEATTLLDRLVDFVRDNSEQGETLGRLRELHLAHLANARVTMETMRTDPDADPSLLFQSDNGTELIGQIRTLAASMIEREQGLLQARSERQQDSLALAYAVLGVAGLLLLVVAAGTIWAVRRNLAELRRSRNTLSGLNEMLEGAVAVRTADLQRANEELQRFAYIVSHDLRSPLVNVMGFTSELEAATGELAALVERAEEAAPDIVTAEARYAVKEDLPEAIGFIRSSTQKMDRLINAILRLSREGRRVITPEPLDMGAMAASIVDTLQHRLGEVGAEIEIEGTLPDIVSDRVAVEQIISNLMENAVKYLKPGRPGRVKVRGKKIGPRVQFEIEDNGRGIDPKDHERVFDLFRRSGTQDQPGEGIGLAHVRALAYRLGGNVTCQSELDEGATFRLSLPQTFNAAKES